MTRRPTIYDYPEHSPARHFAAVAYDSIAATQPRETVERDRPCDSDEEERPGCTARFDDLFVLRRLIGSEKPIKPKKPPAGKEDIRGMVCGTAIDWHLKLPELKLWAGQSTIQTVIFNRMNAIWDADELPDGTRLVDWCLPLESWLGIDSDGKFEPIDIGYSKAVIGEPFAVNVAMELLAIAGMQMTPLVRFAANTYGYWDIHGRLYQFQVRLRSDGYRKAFQPARRVRATEWSEALEEHRE